jgi:hypothetical protein
MYTLKGGKAHYRTPASKGLLEEMTVYGEMEGNPADPQAGQTTGCRRRTNELTTPKIKLVCEHIGKLNK